VSIEKPSFLLVKQQTLGVYENFTELPLRSGNKIKAARPEAGQVYLQTKDRFQFSTPGAVPM
jgi:hypothetical protein